LPILSALAELADGFPADAPSAVIITGRGTVFSLGCDIDLS
jgi:hypothetical protein